MVHTQAKHPRTTPSLLPQEARRTLQTTTRARKVVATLTATQAMELRLSLRHRTASNMANRTRSPLPRSNTTVGVATLSNHQTSVAPTMVEIIARAKDTTRIKGTTITKDTTSTSHQVATILDHLEATTRATLAVASSSNTEAEAALLAVTPEAEADTVDDTDSPRASWRNILLEPSLVRRSLNRKCEVD